MNIRKLVESKLFIEDSSEIIHKFSVGAEDHKIHSIKILEGDLTYNNGELSIYINASRAKQLVSYVNNLLTKIFNLTKSNISSHNWYNDTDNKYYKVTDSTVDEKFNINISNEEFELKLDMFKDGLKNLNKIGNMEIYGVIFDNQKIK